MSGIFGATPYGSIGVDDPVTLCTDTIELRGKIFGIAATPLADSVTFGGEAVGELVSVLLDRLRLTGTVLPSATLHATLTDSLRYEDAMWCGWMLAIQEEIQLAGAAAGNRTVLAVLTDILHATGAVNVTYDARAALASVIALETMMAGGWKVEAIDTIEFQDALAAQLVAITKLVDTAGFTGTATPAMRLLAIAADEVSFGDTPLPSMDLFAQLSDQVLFYGVIRLGESEFTGWALNEGAATEYRNYPFNGMLGFEDDGLGDTYYGTSDSGLYVMEGTDDAGEPIEWAIRTALMDFGTGKLKRVPDCYIAFSGGHKVMLKVITEENGELHAAIYAGQLLEGAALHNDRIKIGRGFSARYWQFELSGEGAFELDELAWRPLILDRRLY